jgi:MFS family permease
MVVGTLVSSTGGVLTGLSASLLTLLSARLLVGMGSSASMSGSTAMMADLTDHAPQHRAKMIGECVPK